MAIARHVVGLTGEGRASCFFDHKDSYDRVAPDEQIPFLSQ